MPWPHSGPQVQQKRNSHCNRPGFHATDNASIVLMSTNATLQLVKQETQLHADDKARHAQEYVAPQLKFVNIQYSILFMCVCMVFFLFFSALCE